MKIEITNSNYAATVVQIDELHPVDGLDNLMAYNKFGYQALVSKETEIGTVGILFPPESQLSDAYARINNLYRKSDKNVDHSQTGYLEDTRRVKAIKLHGVRSDALFMPLSSLLSFCGSLDELKVGDSFNTLDGHDICTKYVLKQPTAHAQGVKYPKFTRVDNVSFPLHIETDNYMRNKDKLNDDDFVTVTQKLHGTSWRGGLIPVRREFGWKDRVAQFFGVRVAETEHDYVYGSRRVIKGGIEKGYYEDDIYTIIGKSVEKKLPKDYMFFGEIIGFTPSGAEIQKSYTYGQFEGFMQLYIYRIAHVVDGDVIDLSWDQVKQMCERLDLNTVPELWRGYHKDFVPEQWIDKRFKDEGYTQALPLSGSKKLKDEGVVVRKEGILPTVLKHKSPEFLGYETKMLDSGVEDTESMG